MILRVDANSEIPICRQIVNGLRIALVNAELVPGDPLPSVRRLALDLGVHFNTVAQAYRELASEGWLTIGARSGATVRLRSMPAPTRADGHDSFQGRLEALVAQMRARGVRPTQLVRELRRMLASLEHGGG